MRNRFRSLLGRLSVAVAIVPAILILLLMQVHAQQPKTGRRPARAAAPQQGVPIEKQKAKADGADPFGKVAAGGALAPGTYHLNFHFRSFDGSPLAASYFPSKLELVAPVVILVHQSGRSRKDFEDPIVELKGEGLAAHLQNLGYAVLSFDRRGQGQNPRRTLTVHDRPLLVEDLQAAYYFLVDRHNRGDLNLAKLGVIALGDGANLAAAWAHQPGAATTIEGRPSDLNALAMFSPMPEGTGFLLGHVLGSLAPRVPLLLAAGERDNPSKDAVASVRAMVERARLNKVELYPSSLHGYTLLRLEPKITTTLFHFLDNSLKGRAADWEPRYNLLPVTLSDTPQVVRNAKAGEPAKAAKAQQPKNAPEPNPGPALENAPKKAARPAPAKANENPN
jgi:Serine aminopeptidase, S33